jgi:hypothetical protein
MRKTYRKARVSRKRGGAATSFPANYFGLTTPTQMISSGKDLLNTYGDTIRARLNITGGKRKTKRRGGFVPSIMGSFSASASKYIAPIALFAGYKLLTRKRKPSKR